MTIYDDILPRTPQHMNEDPYCPWKQCQNPKCGRIFNTHSEPMVTLHIRWGDGLEGKPINPRGPTFTATYCFQCGKHNEKCITEATREKMQEEMK